jgi:hypothetical protein
MTKHQRINLDLSQFESVEDAFAQLEAGEQRLREASQALVNACKYGLTFLHAFALSAVVRAIGLHAAITASVRSSNPHSSFPLLRTYLEVGIVACYVADNPKYAEVLAGRPELVEGSRQRKSSQALIDVAARRYPGIKGAWDELCEATHMGAPAFWIPWIIEDAPSRSTTVASWPRWGTPEQPFIVSAQSLECCAIVCVELSRIKDAYLQSPPPPDEIIAAPTFIAHVP